jgi:hypothetical protein
MQPDRQVTELRRRLRRAGYDPLPLDGKAPCLKEWQKRTGSNDDTIELWGELYPYSTNTGVLTRLAPAIDIDIMNPEAAEAVEQLARERFEERGYFLVRTGKAPKRAILLRTLEPFKKIKASLIAPNGEKAEIEILGDGEQLVVAGRHPETQAAYSWHGGEPGEIKLDELPYVSVDEARTFLDDAVALLTREHGYQLKNKANGKDRRDAPPPDGKRFDWSKFGNLLDHDNLVAVAMALIAGGFDKDATYNLLRSQVEAIDTADIARKQRRLDEMRGVVDSAAAKAGKAGEPPTLESTRASNIEMTAIEWLWPDRFAIGKLGLLVGLPVSPLARQPAMSMPSSTTRKTNASLSSAAKTISQKQRKRHWPTISDSAT